MTTHHQLACDLSLVSNLVFSACPLQKAEWHEAGGQSRATIQHSKKIEVYVVWTFLFPRGRNRGLEWWPCTKATTLEYSSFTPSTCWSRNILTMGLTAPCCCTSSRKARVWMKWWTSIKNTVARSPEALVQVFLSLRSFSSCVCLFFHSLCASSAASEICFFICHLKCHYSKWYQRAIFKFY